MIDYIVVLQKTTSPNAKKRTEKPPSEHWFLQPKNYNTTKAILQAKFLKIKMLHGTVQFSTKNVDFFVEL